MSKRIKIWIAIGLIMPIGLICLNMFYFDPSHKDPLDSKDKIYISAPVLFALYSLHEDSANRLYLDSVISVTGIVQAIEMKKRRYTVTLSSGDSNGAVICEMDTLENNKIKNITKGRNINLVGFCNGILIDVQLDRCKLAK